MNINDLDLFLYDTANSNLVASSVSAVDNVEHLFATALPAGRYDLQVLKKGGFGTTSNNESYALSFEFFSLPLTVERVATNIVISWPMAPTGFHVESTSSLGVPISWVALTNAAVVTNNWNQITLEAGGAAKYFRLAGP
jgi:hypothetical protein